MTLFCFDGAQCGGALRSGCPFIHFAWCSLPRLGCPAEAMFSSTGLHCGQPWNKRDSPHFAIIPNSAPETKRTDEGAEIALLTRPIDVGSCRVVAPFFVRPPPLSNSKRNAISNGGESARRHRSRSLGCCSSRCGGRSIGRSEVACEKLPQTKSNHFGLYVVSQSHARSLLQSFRHKEVTDSQRCDDSFSAPAVANA